MLDGSSEIADKIAAVCDGIEGPPDLIADALLCNVAREIRGTVAHFRPDLSPEQVLKIQIDVYESLVEKIGDILARAGVPVMYEGEGGKDGRRFSDDN